MMKMRICFLLLCLLCARFARAEVYTDSAVGYVLTFPDGWDMVAPIHEQTAVKARRPGEFAAIAVFHPKGVLWGTYESKNYKSLAHFIAKVSRRELVRTFTEAESPEGVVAKLLKIGVSKVGGSDALVIESELKRPSANSHVRVTFRYFHHAGQWLVFSSGTSMKRDSATEAEIEECIKSFRLKAP